MRQDRIIQASIFDLFSEHEIGRELKAMSAWLDAHREVIALVAAELCRPGLKPTGRDGLPAESVLRCALLKQYRQLSYQELAFHLSDSASFRAFARLPLHWCPKKSVLQETISAISARSVFAASELAGTSCRPARLPRRAASARRAWDDAAGKPRSAWSSVPSSLPACPDRRLF